MFTMYHIGHITVEKLIKKKPWNPFHMHSNISEIKVYKCYALGIHIDIDRWPIQICKKPFKIQKYLLIENVINVFKVSVIKDWIKK